MISLKVFYRPFKGCKEWIRLAARRAAHCPRAGQLAAFCDIDPAKIARGYTNPALGVYNLGVLPFEQVSYGSCLDQTHHIIRVGSNRLTTFHRTSGLPVSAFGSELSTGMHHSCGYSHPWPLRCRRKALS